MADKVMVRNAGDRDQVNRAKVTEKVQRENELNDMRAVLATRAGRNVLWRQLTKCHLFESITVQSSQIYALSGSRDAGLALIAEIVEADPAAYLLMQQEAAKMEQAKVEPDPTKADAEESE